MGWEYAPFISPVEFSLHLFILSPIQLLVWGIMNNGKCMIKVKIKSAALAMGRGREADELWDTMK